MAGVTHRGRGEGVEWSVVPGERWRGREEARAARARARAVERDTCASRRARACPTATRARDRLDGLGRGASVASRATTELLARRRIVPQRARECGGGLAASQARKQPGRGRDRREDHDRAFVALLIGLGLSGWPTEDSHLVRWTPQARDDDARLERRGAALRDVIPHHVGSTDEVTHLNPLQQAIRPGSTRSGADTTRFAR